MMKQIGDGLDHPTPLLDQRVVEDHAQTIPTQGARVPRQSVFEPSEEQRERDLFHQGQPVHLFQLEPLVKRVAAVRQFRLGSPYGEWAEEREKDEVPFRRTANWRKASPYFSHSPLKVFEARPGILSKASLTQASPSCGFMCLTPKRDPETDQP